MELTENVNIKEIKPLTSPRALKENLPLPDDLARVVLDARNAIQRIVTREDRRLLVIAGPCSLHDTEASLEYARRLKTLQAELGGAVLLVMRTYFEKPRTTIGWKGMLYDPGLDGSDDIEAGFRLSRSILLEITRIGIPAAVEFLDPIVPQYLADMVSWAAIGARTAASQIHRQMASGLSMPIGFKNAMDGDPHIAIEAIRTAANPHVFLGITGEGQAAIASTRGNRFGHLVLRGGAAGPNYQSEHVAFSEVLLKKAGVTNGIVIDCSHANSNKDYRRQRVAFLDVLGQISAGNRSICGIMLESFLEEGNQPVASWGEKLRFGLSVTDSCIGWQETEELIRRLAGGGWR